MKRLAPFFSEGHLLDADLHLPESSVNGGGPYPTVVACSGFEGLKIIHPERFARALNPRGYAVLAFDYRGFGLSEGERGRLVPQEWVDDVRNAVGSLAAAPEVDPDRVGLLGWGLGGGVVVSAAADDPHVRAVVVANGIGDGLRSTRSMHDEESWAQLLDRIEEDRTARTQRGRSRLIDPWEIVPLGTGTPVGSYVDEQLYRAHGFGSRITVESADHLLRFVPESVVARIAPRPILIVHGEANNLHPRGEAEQLYARAGEPRRLEILPGVGHTEWMFDDHPVFRQVIDMIAGFLDDAVRP